MVDAGVSPNIVLFIVLCLGVAGGLSWLSVVLLRKSPRRPLHIVLSVVSLILAAGVLAYFLFGANGLYVEHAADRLHYRDSRTQVSSVLRWFRETRVPLDAVPSSYRTDEMGTHKERIYRYDLLVPALSIYVVYDDSWRLISSTCTAI